MKRLYRWLVDRQVKGRRPGAFTAYLAAQGIVTAYANADVEFETNGEAWLLRRLGRQGLSSVFDVGANVGDWTSVVLRHSPAATCYCYEAVPTTFAELSAKVQTPQAHLFNMALSDAPGSLDFNASELSVVSSVYDVHRYDETLAVTNVSVPAQTGDAECARLGVTHIDMLKIDTEGHDLLVLRGFAEMLGRGAIDMIQFEYNLFTLLARNALFDFYDLLAERYVLCRLLPKSLELMGYDYGLDNFAQSNWICVRKDLVTRDLVDRLSIHLPDGHRRAIARDSLADRPDVLRLFV